MSAIPPWIERKFDFDFPVTLYPNIVSRYRGTPARLEEAVHGLSRELLVAKPVGSWSIQENAGHLSDEEALFTTRLHEFLMSAEKSTPAPYKHIDLTHNDRRIEDLLRHFRAAREAQVKQLEKLSLNDFARTAWHPRLNVPMRLIDHVLFVAERDDHHLARIWELRCNQ